MSLPSAIETVGELSCCCCFPSVPSRRSATEGKTCSDYWLDIVYHGRKSSSYKFALGFALGRFVDRGKRLVSYAELADAFLDICAERLTACKPQMSNPGHSTVVEQVIRLRAQGTVTRDKAIEIVQQRAFRYVIQSFHIVRGGPVPVRFFEADGQSLELTDCVYEVFSPPSRDHVLSEMKSAWASLEDSFARRVVSGVVSSVRQHESVGESALLSGGELGQSDVRKVIEGSATLDPTSQRIWHRLTAEIRKATKAVNAAGSMLFEPGNIRLLGGWRRVRTNWRS